MASPYDGKARIYALADPALLADARDLVARAVLAALKVAPSDRHRVVVSPSSGSLDYRAEGELWNRVPAPTLPARAEALKAAESLLVDVERTCSDANDRWSGQLSGIALLPPVGLLRRSGLYAVPRPGTAVFDHWLYRAQPQLYVDGAASQRVDVFGAHVEVRIGHGGRPISLRTRWRPLSGERTYAEFVPFTSASAPARNPTAAGQTPPLAYVLQGDGIPQFYLAPYYAAIGDDVSLTGASAYSLTVQLDRVGQNRETMTLAAVARGGSGDYLYNWACYRLAAVEDGIRELGPGTAISAGSGSSRVLATSIAVENGGYMMLLHVKDRATGAFYHHQQVVFSDPVAGARLDDAPIVQVG